MRIAFLRPSMTGRPSSDALEPAVFAVLAALTPEADDTALFDERVAPLPSGLRADLAALTVDTFGARRAYEIASGLRRRGVRVVLGGPHPTLCPEEALGHADAVVRGDAESVWPRLVADARRGRLAPLYEGGRPDAPHPAPDRRVFGGLGYRRLRLVQVARGCHHACDFCSVHAAYGGRTAGRGLDAVVSEVGAGSGDVFFTDDNLFADARSMRALCGALAPLGVSWSCQVSLDVAERPGLVAEMAAAGCRAALVGLESLDEDNLRQMGKGWSRRAGTLLDRLAVFRDHGVMLYGTFVFGYDADTVDTVRRTLDFALGAKLFLANFNPLVPTPGTGLYGRLRAEGRLLSERWWLDPAYRYGDVVFRPRSVESAELAEACYRAKLAFNSISGIARRALDPSANARSPGNLGLYLAANWVNRREVRRKQGLPLGAGAA